MDVCVDALVYDLDPPAELTPEILPMIDPKSGKTLFELAIALGMVDVSII